jgi:hypothetical protein
MATIATACVLRDLSDGTGPQYVPLSEVAYYDPKETAFVGAWRPVHEKHGPSGSHLRTVCTPAGALSEVPAQSALEMMRK